MLKRVTCIAAVLCLVAAAVITGCAYTAGSGLPAHIKTVEVNAFGNTTYYHSLETQLTANVINQINLSPGLKVVNTKGDATLSGEIYKLRNVVTELDSNNQPKTVYISVSAKFSLYDNTKSVFIFRDKEVISSQSSSTAGRLKVDRGQSWASARSAAVDELAKTLMRNIGGSN